MSTENNYSLTNIDLKEKDLILINYNGQTLSITQENMEALIEAGFTYSTSSNSFILN